VNIQLWTDGSCIGNPGPGGWAALLLAVKNNQIVGERLLSGHKLDTKNNRMELYAVIAGLDALTAPCAVTVYTDSQYVIKCGAGEWARRANIDLWLAYERVVQPHTIAFQKVKAHSGIEHNERVDRESFRQAQIARRAA
jgi:ribonuclease HI